MYADFKINEQKKDSSGIPRWDFDLVRGGIHLTTGNSAMFQRACVATFLIKNTFKSLEAGIDWTTFLAPENEIERMDIDDITQAILENLNEQDVPNYFPIFSTTSTTNTSSGGERNYLTVSVTDGKNR